MDLYIDTANLEEIRKAADLGVLDGVTTNPSLIAKEGVDYVKRLAEICEVVKGPVSAEVIATDYEGMVREGRERAKIAGNIVVKLPSTIAGLKACKTLTDEGTQTNMTLCFQTLQALMVAKAGAFLVSPFIGRLDDAPPTGWTSFARYARCTTTTGSRRRFWRRRSGTRCTWCSAPWPGRTWRPCRTR